MGGIEKGMKPRLAFSHFPLHFLLLSDISENPECTGVFALFTETGGGGNHDGSPFSVGADNFEFIRTLLPLFSFCRFLKDNLFLFW